MSSDNEQVARNFLAGTSSLDEYLSYFANNCHYKVANQPAVQGLEALGQAAGRFRSLVKKVDHKILSLWSMGDRVVCELEATYTRTDDQQVTIPCLDIFTFDQGKIKSLQIFADMLPVFKP